MIARGVLRQILAGSGRRFFAAAPGEELVVQTTNSSQIFVLNRPKALNALNLSMVRKMYPLLKQSNSDSNVSFVLIKGTGQKAFCAGGDVLAISNAASSNDPNERLHIDFFREEYLLNHLIGVLKVPYIAFMDGITMGGGCGLSLHGQFRIATERTVLAMPEVALGLFPDVGATYVLSRLPYSLGQFLGLTGYRLEGADVYHTGLATHYIPSEKLKSVEAELIGMDHNLVNQETIDHVLNKYHVSDSEMPKFSLERRLAQIDSTYCGGTLESVLKKLRQNDDDFSRKYLNAINKMSPTSLKVTFRQLQVGLKMKFSEVFTMEYRLSQRIVKGHDFHEGCRAILVDKDQKPKWKPANVEEVPDELLNQYFSPLPKDQELIVKDHL